MTQPHEDPVRQAFARYLERFPEVAEARLLEAETHALLTQMERMLVAVDCAMQDEGLDPAARRRVISTALFGGVDQERAARNLEKYELRMETAKKLGLEHKIKPENLS